MANQVNEYIKKMLDTAKTRKRREDLSKGEYVATVMGLTHERRAKREKLGKCFWIDIVIDEAEAVGDSTPTPAGSFLDFPLVLEGQYADMAFSDLKTFLAELTGCDEEEVSSKFNELVDSVSDEGKHSNPTQPARGMRIAFSTYEHTAKGGKNIGKTRTYPKWKSFPQTAAEIAERRKEVEASA